jgi:hypothetical protein
MGCSRGDVQPKPGATVWAVVGWVNGRRRRSGPAVRNRTWTLPYTPSGAKPIRFTTIPR